jgi:hypothetical protein
MNSTELDTAYTALAEAIGRVETFGEGKTQLMLATLSLSLIAKMDNAASALTLIQQAENLTKEKS